MKTNLFFKLFISALTIFGASHSYAVAMDFTGIYRFEWMELDRPSLSDPYQRKAYGLNYLGLNGKIIASDGINIHTRFDILSNSDPAYQNTQFGQQWGSGNTNASTYPANSTATSKSPESQFLKVSQLYLNVSQEYASIIVGRAPFHFGLGINYNAGLDPFDHYSTVMDMVAVKFLIDNVKYMPMIAQVYDPSISQGGLLQSQSFLVEYESPDNGNLIGVMLERKKGSSGVNDIPVNTGVAPFNNPNGISADSGTDRSDIALQRTSFVLGKEWEPFGFKLEAGFVTGDLGIQKASQGLHWNAYGIATEMYFPRPQSKWDWRLHMGFATGDNPDTADYESFHFDRNYDVAFLLFNHRLGSGSYDLLRTGLIRDQYNPSGGVRKSIAESLDDEAISNTLYVSPRVKYIWNDKLDLVNTITFANLVANPLSGVNVNKSLGFEWDVKLVYRPREKVQWVNEIGFLFPGSAFKVDSITDSGKNFTYGFSSKAVISF